MTTFPRRDRVRAAALVLLVVVAACESSDKLPPKGSIVTVAANPATIPLGSGQECTLISVTRCGTAQVVATVASELGTPLPDQDVRFSSTAGFLFTGDTASPVAAANVPIATDKFGNAHVSLITSTTASVTAKSGTASGTLTINTVVGNLNRIVLNFNTDTTLGCPSSPDITDCDKTICVEAEAQDSTGKDIEGVLIVFDLQNNVFDGNTFKGNFNPTQQSTVAMPAGSTTIFKALTKFKPDSTCQAQCSASAMPPKSCAAEVVATTQGGSFRSAGLPLTISIP